MINNFCSIILLLLLSLPAHSQNGKLINQFPYVFADSSIKKLEKVIPDVQSVLNSVDFYSITYLSDGLKVNGYLAVPRKEGMYPGIICNRGGHGALGALDDTQIFRMLGMVASYGYVCIGSQYRGNGGSEGKEEFGGRDVDDVLNLIPCLSEIKKADTSRLGMYGWSRGGMETYLALTRTCRMKAAVIMSGMADAFITIQKRPQMENQYKDLAPGYAQNKDSVLQSRSAVRFAEKICPSTPLLLLTGTADWRVSPEEQLELVNRLYQLKHPLRFEMFEGAQHNLIEHSEEVQHSIKVFLDKYVRDKQTYPPLEPHGN